MNSLGHRFRVGCDRKHIVALQTAAWPAILALALPLLLLGDSQAKSGDSHGKTDVAGPAAVKKVKLVLDKGTPGLEIVTTSPVDPHISKLDDAMHLIIDLPNTSMSVSDKVVPLKNRDLGELRLIRYDIAPPMVRVEVAFHKPMGYTWDSVGSRLVVSFHEISEKDASPASAAAPADSPLPVAAPAIGVDFVNVVPVERVSSGSSIAADMETTVLRVKRAGDVYVCPRTTVSIVRSKDGPDLMLAINGGGLETHLTLKNSADEVVTPDFRILLRGPGEFHYAIRSDSQGSACIKPLPGNKATAIIYEQMGDGQYQLQHGDELVFHDGKLISNAGAHSDSKNFPYTVLPVECGCPPPQRQALLAFNAPESQIVAGNSTSNHSSSVEDHAEPDSTEGKNSVTPAHSDVQIPDLPEALRAQPHVQVEASLTFTPGLAATGHLPATSRLLSSPLTALPPARDPQRHKTVLGKIKRFFSRVFD
jgi:hypothetical protein